MKKLIPILLITVVFAVLAWRLGASSMLVQQENTPTVTLETQIAELGVGLSDEERNGQANTKAGKQTNMTGPGRRTGKPWPSPSEEEFLAMSPEQQALVVNHIDLGDQSTLAAYFFELEEIVGAGEGGELNLAELYGSCRSLMNADLAPNLKDSEDPVLRSQATMQEMCRTLPDRGEGYAAKLVHDCAVRGDRDCILQEYPPPAVVRSPNSPVAEAWGRDMMGRLQALANAGDRDAAYQAAQYFGFTGEKYGIKDRQQAAVYLDYYLSSANPNQRDFRLSTAATLLSQICGSVNREDWNEQCR